MMGDDANTSSLSIAIKVNPFIKTYHYLDTRLDACASTIRHGFQNGLFPNKRILTFEFSQGLTLILDTAEKGDEAAGLAPCPIWLLENAGKITEYIQLVEQADQSSLKSRRNAAYKSISDKDKNTFAIYQSLKPFIQPLNLQKIKSIYGEICAKARSTQDNSHTRALIDVCQIILTNSISEFNKLQILAILLNSPNYDSPNQKRINWLNKNTYPIVLNLMQSAICNAHGPAQILETNLLFLQYFYFTDNSNAKPEGLVWSAWNLVIELTTKKHVKSAYNLYLMLIDTTFLIENYQEKFLNHCSMSFYTLTKQLLLALNNSQQQYHLLSEIYERISSKILREKYRHNREHINKLFIKLAATKNPAEKEWLEQLAAQPFIPSHADMKRSDSQALIQDNLEEIENLRSFLNSISKLALKYIKNTDLNYNLLILTRIILNTYIYEHCFSQLLKERIRTLSHLKPFRNLAARNPCSSFDRLNKELNDYLTENKSLILKIAFFTDTLIYNDMKTVTNDSSVAKRILALLKHLLSIISFDGYLLYRTGEKDAETYTLLIRTSLTETLKKIINDFTSRQRYSSFHEIYDETTLPTLQEQDYQSFEMLLITLFNLETKYLHYGSALENEDYYQAQDIQVHQARPSLSLIELPCAKKCEKDDELPTTFIPANFTSSHSILWPSRNSTPHHDTSTETQSLKRSTTAEDQQKNKRPCTTYTPPGFTL